MADLIYQVYVLEERIFLVFLTNAIIQNLTKYLSLL